MIYCRTSRVFHRSAFRPIILESALLSCCKSVQQLPWFLNRNDSARFVAGFVSQISWIRARFIYRVHPIWRRQIRPVWPDLWPTEATGRGRLLNNYTYVWVCNCIYSTDLKLASTDYFRYKITQRLYSSNISGILISLTYLSVRTLVALAPASLSITGRVC